MVIGADVRAKNERATQVPKLAISRPAAREDLKVSGPPMVDPSTFRWKYIRGSKFSRSSRPPKSSWQIEDELEIKNRFLQPLKRLSSAGRKLSIFPLRHGESTLPKKVFTLFFLTSNETHEIPQGYPFFFKTATRG
jgi:hypothetical protein